MYAKSFAGAFLVAALSGCPGSVSGTVSGIGLTVSDTIFYPVKDNAGKTTNLIILLADKGNLCSMLKANRQPKSATGLQIVFYRWGTDNTVLAPDTGDYTVVPGGTSVSNGGNYAMASFMHFDANCSNTLSADAAAGKSGLVKLTSVNSAVNGSASGSFDITFGTDRVTGGFSGAYCDMGSLPNNPSCE